MSADITATASASNPAVSAESSPSFDADEYLPKPKTMRGWSLKLFSGLAWLLRTFWPIPRLFKWAAVTRYDDVAEVLTRHDMFSVPFSKEIARLNDGGDPGTPFILGIDGEAEHDKQLKLVMEEFKRSDVKDRVRRVSQDSARKIIEESSKVGIDAIRTLITGVPLEVCEQYYGVGIPGDRQAFAYATIAVSGHLFGLPPIVPKSSVDVAAAYVRDVVQCAIDGEVNRQKSGQPGGEDTILERLVRRSRTNPNELSLKQVRAFLIGMIVGFVPTNTMAGGHILEMLLRRQEFKDAATKAAVAGDDDLLTHCLFEALRFWPINFGPFRECKHDYTVAADTPHATSIRKDSIVLASAMSAMFDSRQIEKPFEFNPGRPASNYMHFGYGMHWCVGVFIAQAQITQTFKALLTQEQLCRSRVCDGRLKLRGGFPDQLCVDLQTVKS